jgi:manganese-transporting P-type ATPase
VFCFDKTGTLTKDKIDLIGLTNPMVSSLSEFNNSPENNTYGLTSDIILTNQSTDLIKIHLACCHAVFFSNGGLTGDSMEVDAFLSSGFRFVSSSSFDNFTNDEHNVKVLKRFAFSSQLRRMSVVVSVCKDMENFTNDLYVFMKGAPETVAEMLITVPPFYWSTFENYSKKGYRILAISGKRLHRIEDYKREIVEKDLIFLGFLLFSTQLKPDTKSVIRELRQTSSMLKMITGDGALVALDVAKRAGFVKKNQVFMELFEVANSEKFVWQLASFHTENSDLYATDVDFDLKTLSSLSRLQCLCLTGNVLSSLVRANLDISSILPHISIFARMNPNQKAFIINSFVKGGSCVLMCGDGTNDVGALREANVGVSIVNDVLLESKLDLIQSSKTGSGAGSRTDRLNRAIAELQLQEADPTIVKLGDASLASSFTARRTSIDSVLSIVRQGRCTLVTTVQIYKILTLNCVVSAYVMSYMHVQGLRQGDVQMTAVGIMNAGLFFFLSQTKPIESIAAKNPVPSIFKPSILISLFGQCIIHFTSLILILSMCDTERSDDIQLSHEGTFQPNVVNSSIFLASLTITVNNFVANYRGYPYTQSMTENVAFYRVICALYFCILVVLGNQIVFVNDFLQMQHFPSAKFQTKLGLILLFDFMGSLASEYAGRWLES